MSIRFDEFQIALSFETCYQEAQARAEEPYDRAEFLCRVVKWLDSVGSRPPSPAYGPFAHRMFEIFFNRRREIYLHVQN